MVKQKKAKRLYSLDAYRGFVMIILASHGFGIVAASNLPGGEFLEPYKFFVTHPQWISNFNYVGISPWDLIQPAFMFMVGVSMPYSYMKRKERGDSYFSRLSHAWTRAILLILLCIFLRSNGGKETNWTFIDVVGQIGLGYGFLFFLVGRKFITQAIAGIVVLGFTIGVFYYYAPTEDPWAFNANVFSQWNHWFLNLFPRTEPFVENRGGYSTFNFIPSFVTMLMGVMCGQLLKSEDKTAWRKVSILAIASLLSLGVGLLLSETGVCPIIKKIWTPSWVFFSGAYVMAGLMFFYLIIDVIRIRFWAFPLVVVGLNPLAMYCMGWLIRGWTKKTFLTHLPDDWFAGWQGQIIMSCSILAFFWLITFWMYRRKFFIRL